MAREVAAQGGDPAELLPRQIAAVYGWGRSVSAGRAEMARCGSLLKGNHEEGQERRSLSLGRAGGPQASFHRSQSAADSVQEQVVRTLLAVGSGRRHNVCAADAAGQPVLGLAADTALGPAAMGLTNSAATAGVTDTVDAGGAASFPAPSNANGSVHAAGTLCRAEGVTGSGTFGMGALDQLARSSLLLIDPVVAGIVAGLASGRASTAAMSSSRGSVLFTGSIYSSHTSCSGALAPMDGVQSLQSSAHAPPSQQLTGPLLKKVAEELPDMEGEIVGKVMALEGTLLGALCASGQTTRTVADCHALLASHAVQQPQVAVAVPGACPGAPVASNGPVLRSCVGGTGVGGAYSHAAEAERGVQGTDQPGPNLSRSSPSAHEGLSCQQQQQQPFQLAGPSRVQVGGSEKQGRSAMQRPQGRGGADRASPSRPPATAAKAAPPSPPQRPSQQPYFDLLLLRKPRACIVAQLALTSPASTGTPAAAESTPGNGLPHATPHSADYFTGANREPATGTSVSGSVPNLLSFGKHASAPQVLANPPPAAAASKQPQRPRNVLGFYVHIADRLQPYLLDDLSHALQQILHTLQPLLSEVLLGEHGEAWAAIQDHVLGAGGSEV